MQVAVWTESIKDKRLQEILKSSVNNIPTGWVSSIEDGQEYNKFADVDVIFGSWKSYDAPHHRLKREVVKGSKNVLVIETPLLGRGPVHEVCQDNAFRVGLNGFMSDAVWPSIGIDRVRRLAKQFKIPEDPKVIEGGDYILIPLQLPGDASLQGTDINQWMKKTVEEIRSITDRKIVLRSPQLERNYDFSFAENIRDIFFQKGKFKDKQVTLNNAYAVVTYSSGMSVEAILNGNRTYVESSEGFKASLQPSLEDVLMKDYVNFPNTDDYISFFQKIAATYWTVDEINKGLFWEGFKDVI